MRNWKKPVIRTMDERALLEKLSIKAASGPSHTDAHSNTGHSDGHTNSHSNTH